MTVDVVHIIGARPNFPKAAPVIHALAGKGVRQAVVHTGQHYDNAMSDTFLQQLRIPAPAINLGVGSGSHAVQTAAVMIGVEDYLMAETPAVVTVYGDVNSTLAATLAASKLGIPVAHVEAGLRSGDRSMPEEINRLVTDRLADLLFATSPDAVAHLGNEGINPDRIHFVGNPMIDSLLANISLFDAERFKAQFGLADRYAVATLHRPSNVDNASQTSELVKSIHACADSVQIVMPMHPRGRAQLEASGMLSHPNIRSMDPLPYVDFVSAVRGAAVVLTDSGGVQEETTFLGIPCLTLRPNTERPITITHGTNRLVQPETVVAALEKVLSTGRAENWPVPPLWDGNAGRRIAAVLADFIEPEERCSFDRR